MKSACSIFFHNYYGEHEYWINFFTKNLSIPYTLYYNAVKNSIYNFESIESADIYSNQIGSTNNTQKLIYRQSSNKGKDIGGKLVLLDAYQKLALKTDYGLFLHDKKSPYKANNTVWASDLLKITDSAFARKSLQIFEESPDVGIITATGNLKNEYDDDKKSFISTNKALLPQLQNRFSIYPASFQYVAGTMFWFRMKPLNTFLKEHSPLKIRALLENGNVTDENEGSYTHCWERLLSWIITSQGYKIKTI